MILAAHSAAGQAAGYIFQPERALLWLSRCPAGSIVGVETEDDVVIRMADGTATHEQTKHSISPDRVPFGDRSHDLWNTIAIWVAAVDANEINLANTTLYLTTNRVLPDCIVKRLMDAPTELDKCIADLKAAATSPTEAIAASVKKVLAWSDLLLKALLSRVKVEDGTRASSGDALRREIASNLHLPMSMPWSDLLDSLGGWVVARLMEQWRSQKPGVIAREAFDRQYQRLTTIHQQRCRRADPAHMVHVAAAEITRKRKSKFVRQLRCISLVERDKEIEEAILDYLRCSSERLRLSGLGEITADELTAFDENLKRRWTAIRRRCCGANENTLSAKQASDVGYTILSGTLEHKEPLGGVDQEPYMTAGGFHRLADEERIYWNPLRPWRRSGKGGV